MKLDARGRISILELVVYLPSFVVAAIVCRRHGFGRSSGCVFTLILCLVRIVGAGCQLATYNDQSSGLLEATIILDSIGLSPLLLATLGLLARCADSINQTSSTQLHMLYFRVIQLLITLGLILSIVGGTSSISSTGVYKVQTTSQVGVILYVVTYIALVLMTLGTIFNATYLPSGEKGFVWAVLIAMPLILVRLIYSLLLVFHHDKNFNLLSGSTVIFAVMTVVEEILVVLIYLTLGWMTDAASKAVERPIESRPWRGTRAVGNGPRGGHAMRRGPIHALVGLAMDSRRAN